METNFISQLSTCKHLKPRLVLTCAVIVLVAFGTLSRWPCIFIADNTHNLNVSMIFRPMTVIYHRERSSNISTQLTQKGQSVQFDSQKFAKANCSHKLPDCIIIGVQKCGTSALAEFLNIHPDIAANSKQTNYFSSNYFLGIDWYKSLLPCSYPNQIAIEKTPQYFYFRRVPGRIKQMKPDVKLLLIVRDPVGRAISNFAMAQYRKRENAKALFEERVLIHAGKKTEVNSSNKYIIKSTYSRFLQMWLSEFPRRQIHIVDGERFIANPAVELAKVETFLGLKSYIKPEHFSHNSQSGFNCVNKSNSTRTFQCLRKTKGRRHPYVSKEVQALLRDYFSDKNEKFFELINETFQW